MKGFYSLLSVVLLFVGLQPAVAQLRHERVDLSKIPIEKLKQDCKFFTGDTLNGFPLEATIEKYVKQLDIYMELKSLVYFEEAAFVKQKYHIQQLPHEVEAARKVVSNPVVLSGSCNNVDFENGTFSGWIGNIGYNANSNASLTNTAAGINTLGVNSPETGCSFHTLMTTGTDPNGGFPVVDPGGGTYAVRLGGENINTNNYVPAGCTVTHPSGNPDYYSNGETLEQTFLVTNTNSLFTYNYAVVLERATHVNGQQPYFRVEVLDNTNTSIPCLNYYVQGDPSGNYPAGFINVGGANGIEYLPWQTSSLNLLPYRGQNVTVRFTAAGCIPGGHFGYGYVDCSCAPLEIIIPTFECQGGVDSLIAPPVSGSTYAWAGPGIVSGATAQIATANVSGTYSVTITNAAGCSYVLDTTLVFYPNPTVSVTSPSVCAGGTTTLTASSTGSAGTLTYTWSPSAGLTLSAGDSTGTITPPSSTAYTVTGTSVNGCTNTAVSNITVNSSPAPTFNAPPVCTGVATLFTNTTAGGSIYNWDFGDATSTSDTSTQQSPSYTYPLAGNYAVSLTVTTTSGCISYGTQTVTVNPLPTATFSAADVCLNNATVFTSTITNGSTYNWDYGDGTVAPGSATPSHTYGTSNTFAVTLTVTSVSSCTAVATNTVLVNPLPVPAFSSTPVCQGSGVVFTNTSTLSAACAWNFWGAGNPASATTNCSPTYTYLNAGTFAVTLTVTSAASCTATTTGSATVNALPALTFTADHPCDGTAMNFSNTTANQAAFSNWHWDFGNGDTSNLASPPAYTYTAPAGFSAAGCYSVVLTATATTGCTGSHDTTVYVHNNPFAYFNAFEACMGDASEFVDSSFVQNPACLSDQIVSWNYDFGDGQTANYTASTLPDTIMHTYANCGAYNITATVTTNNGCTFSNTITGDTVFCLPVVTGPTDFSVCPGSATPVQTFSTTCGNGGTPFSEWFQSLSNVDNTGAPPNFINPGGIDQVPSYNAIAQNMSCTVLSDTVFAVAVSGVGCVGNAVYYVANVYPTPYLAHMITDSICANQTINIPNFTACPASSTIAWTNSNPSIGLGASGTGNIGSFTGTNTSYSLNAGQIDAVPTANGCTGNDSSFTIIIKPLPSMAVASPAPYCPGDNVPSPAPTFSPSAGVTYNWTTSNYTNIGMPASGSGLPAPYTAPPNNSLADQSGVVTYSPTYDGCAGPPTTETITIKPTPFVTPVADQFYCPQTIVPQINFNCSPSGGTPVFSYSGLGGIGIIQTGSIPSFTATNGGSMPIVSTVSVNATLNGCQGPDIDFNITVFANPVANFSYTPVCEGSTVHFTDESSISGFSISSWQWTLDNGGVFSTSQNPVYNVTPAGTHSATLLVSTSSVPSCTAQTTEPVIIYPNPHGDFVGVDLKGCSPLNTSFTYLAGGDTVKIAYWNWNFGNGQMFGAASPTGQFPQSQDYTNASATLPKYYSASLIVTSYNGCKDTISKSNYIEVYPKPVPGFSWGPTDVDITEPKITFVNQAIGAATYTPTLMYGPYGVEYYVGDTYPGNTSPNNVYNNTSFSHVYSDPDLGNVVETYNVTQWVINSYGCRDSITLPVEIQPIFTFYIPNAFTPNNDGKNEGFKGTGIGIDNSTYNLWIFDRWGLMIYHAQGLEQAWDGHMKGREGQPVLQEDVYVWKVSFNDIFHKQHEYHGTVTLIK